MKVKQKKKLLKALDCIKDFRQHKEQIVYPLSDDLATFLHKFNPEQFEIIKFRKGNDEKDLSINGKCPYFRILIKNKRIQTELTDNVYSKTCENINLFSIA